MTLYAFLDKFFFVLHSTIILFNLFGWIWWRTRKVNLILLALTAFSWFFLGIWYGLGYCPFTDWHWEVRARLGFHDMPNSYVKFLIDSMTGLDVDAQIVDVLTAACFFCALAASIYTNVKASIYKRRRST